MSIELKCENRGASTKISAAIRLRRVMGNKGSQNCLSEFLAAKEMDGTVWKREAVWESEAARREQREVREY